MSASTSGRSVTVTGPAYQPNRQDVRMRVVVAPDSFGGTLRADQAATAFATGWHDVAPTDELVLAPLSDGGPGLVAALTAASPDAVTIPVACSGPTGEPVTADILRIGSTGYVESASACGLEQVRAVGGDVRTATTFGVGQLVAAAAAIDGIDVVIVGLGGSGTNDGGAGMWAALGAQPADRLRGGGVALRGLTAVDPPDAVGVRLVAATDVDNPLLGLTGASAVYGPQKGADRETVMALDLALGDWADAAEGAARRPARDVPGAGAAGGLGFGLLVLGADRASGSALVIDAVRLAEKVAAADLVVTGEGRFDATSLRGKVPSAVARLAQEAGIPCLVVAGQSSVGTRDAAAAGIDEIWSVADALGSVDAALAGGAEGVRAVGRAVGRSWSR
jgi:glycerate kinase